MQYSVKQLESPIIRTHWCKDLDTLVPSTVWWVEGQGQLTGSLAGKRWTENRPATEAEIEMVQEIERLKKELRSAPVGLCGAAFEHAKETCELMVGHTGMHVARVSGGLVSRP